MSIDKKEFNLSIIDLLHSFISDNQVYLSKYCTDLIIKYVLNPEYNDEWEHKNIDLVYINCTNGQALLFLSEILKIDVSIKNKFNIIWDKVEKLTLASKIALINVLSTLYNSNKDFSLSLLKRIVFSDKKIVNSENFVNFIFSTAFLDNFNFYSDLLKKLDSNEKSVKVLISQMYVHYGLHLKQAQEMALKYIYSNDLDCRIGAAKVFSQYAQNENINKTSFFIENFDKLLNDEKDVVDACLKFLHEFNCFEEIFEFPLYKNIIESKGLRSCLHLLCKFKESPINKKYLNEYKYLIRKFLYLSKKSNLNCRESKEISELFEIILKVYEIQEDKEILDIIDEFLLTPVYSYRDKINNFERCL